MGKYMRKCRAIGELEASQLAGVRTRAMTAAEKAAKRRKGASSTAVIHHHHQVAYLELRSRSLVMTPPQISRSGLNASTCRTPEISQISRCSSNASCDAAVLRSGDNKVDEDSESAACCSDFRHEKRETTPSSNRSDESHNLESMAPETQARQRSTALITPPDEEIEEFFTAAERTVAQRFAKTYNYDIVNGVPFEGRYEWVRITP